MARKADDASETKRGRGRPAGGGNNVQQAQTLLLDAAEGLLLRRGYAASTMDAIAREAGYSRAVVYRHFRGRDELIDALVLRAAMNEIARTAPRLMLDNLGDMITESIVITAVEVGANPLIRILAERDGQGSVASLIVNSRNLADLMSTLYAGLFSFRSADVRPGLLPADAAQYMLSVTLSLFLGLIPGVDDPDQVRRYARVFVLPALLADPPAAEAVFDHAAG